MKTAERNTYSLNPGKIPFFSKRKEKNCSSTESRQLQFIFHLMLKIVLWYSLLHDISFRRTRFVLPAKFKIGKMGPSVFIPPPRWVGGWSISFFTDWTEIIFGWRQILHILLPQHLNGIIRKERQLLANISTFASLHSPLQNSLEEPHAEWGFS